MKLQTVDKFLFCFDLKQGSLALGYFFAFVTGGGAIKLLIDLIFYRKKIKHELFDRAKQVEGILPGAEVVGNAVQPSKSEQEDLSTFGENIW